MSAEPKELYSLLIPLRSERLLVPRMCVAEVIAFVDAARSRDDAAPDWYLGAIEWNNRRLPVVSFDVSGRRRKSKRTRTRVVVSRDHAGSSARGILTQGFPQLVRVNADVLGLETEQPLPDGPGAVPGANDPRVSADPRRRAPREDDRRDPA